MNTFILDSEALTDAVSIGNQDAYNEMLKLAEEYLQNGGKVDYGYYYFDSLNNNQKEFQKLMSWSSVAEFLKWKEEAAPRFLS